MPALARRRSKDGREECWHVYYGVVRGGNRDPLRQFSRRRSVGLELWLLSGQPSKEIPSAFDDSPVKGR
jgi:hypothetical protein